MIEQVGYTKYKLIKIMLVLFVFGVILVPFLANDKAILCFCKEGITMPVFQKHVVSTQNTSPTCSYCIFPPVRYTAYQIDLKNSGYTGPFDIQNIPSVFHRHWLGTDKIGRDVAAGLLYGARNSLLIGLLSMILGLLLGVPTGMILGYFQDNTIRWNVVQIVLFLLYLFLSIFYAIYLPSGEWGFPLFIIMYTIIFIFLFRISGLQKLKKYNIPIDLLGYRILEWRKSIPALFLLLALLSLISKPSVMSVLIIIGLLAWADIARMIRAETLTIKTRPYVLSGISMGMNHNQILKKYVLPGLSDTILVIAIYMFAGAILTESTLSYLGLGLPADEVSWGKMLSESRQARAWWMAVFPGLCLVGLLYYLHRFTNQKMFT
ncbi:MAG: ABC transporter permease [Saprospiraceae bacterium]|nr:ABC transporter permease [Saprospiraceae bacterium]